MPDSESFKKSKRRASNADTGSTNNMFKNLKFAPGFRKPTGNKKRKHKRRKTSHISSAQKNSGRSGGSIKKSSRAPFEHGCIVGNRVKAVRYEAAGTSVPGPASNSDDINMIPDVPSESDGDIDLDQDSGENCADGDDLVSRIGPEGWPQAATKVSYTDSLLFKNSVPDAMRDEFYRSFVQVRKISDASHPCLISMAFLQPQTSRKILL